MERSDLLGPIGAHFDESCITPVLSAALGGGPKEDVGLVANRGVEPLIAAGRTGRLCFVFGIGAARERDSGQRAGNAVNAAVDEAAYT